MSYGTYDGISHHNMPENDMRAQRGPGECRLPLAMAWFEDQKFSQMYTSEEAYMRGTLFPELDKPWLAAKGGASR